MQNLRQRNFNAAVPIADSATVRDRVDSKNSSDLYSFSVATVSKLSLKFRSSGNARVQLIQDRNRNGVLDAGETLRTGRMRPNKPGAIDVATAATGTYFIQVSNTKRGTSNYRLTLGATAATPAQPDKPSVSQPNPSLAEQVVALVNDFRSRNGSAPLSLNNQLNTAAQGHSQNMALQDFFDHRGKDGSDFGQRIQATGYRFRSAAENIGVGQTTPAAIVDGWINSPGHRANMLNPNLREAGVGHYFLVNDSGNERWGHYWTLNLASPQ